MDGFRVICTIVVTVVAYADFCAADREFMVSKAHSIAVSINFETKLECEMNIQPDNFQWKFYPLNKKEAYNPKARISLTTSTFQFVPPSKYENTNAKKMSLLTLQADSNEIAGDYQCLAHYGASVVASVPWRVTIANLNEFHYQPNVSATVVAGNTVNWRCNPPVANPEPYVDYFRNRDYFKSLVPLSTKSLVIPTVGTEHSGDYTCRAGNVERKLNSSVVFSLNVVRNGPVEQPRFIMKPPDSYNVTKGDTVFLECAAVGNPVPKVFWTKKSGVIPEHRSEMIYGGLKIRNVSSSDGGVYECVHKNKQGMVSHSITLFYNEPPSVNCLLDTTDIPEGENLDLECAVTGVPKPEISWFLNGFVVTKDRNITTHGNKIFFKPAQKRHAGNLQMFARNDIGTVYRSIFVKVIPISTTNDNGGEAAVVDPTRKPTKHRKMVPPSKPTISRISDEAVLLRWSVQSKGLQIKFFKVQYKDLGSANQHPPHKGKAWMTTNADIEPHITSYEVTNLKPEHWYRFRIAAVYSNDDNKNSPNSDRFFLKKLDFDNRNPAPVPIITDVETVNSTSIQVYWTFAPSPNITVEGFHINYNSASSAGPYKIATVDGPNTTSYVLSYLQPDTVYDIKLQSFTSKGASHCSQIKQVKTLGVSTTTVVPPMSSTAANIESAGFSKLYIFIAAGVLGACGVIGAVVGILLFCRKSKQKKSGNRGVDDHHIQADGNEYVVGPKGVPRSNGCPPSNRINITANPLSDADNKKFLARIFSRIRT
ncbi:interference hedgehog-like isoform X3 [Zophobas morio]|uniref:interference hedgehog-like isoform X3 n=1 Tax=Zophobas morio TaxID=2755281 RepID=UPI00308296FA